MDGVQSVNRGEDKKRHMKALGAKLSKAGSVISLVCAVHCALTPLALLALPLLAAQYGWGVEGFLSPLFGPLAEWLFLGLILVFAGFGVLVTFPVHRDSRPALYTAVGLLMLLSVRVLVEEGSSVETAGKLMGASLIVWAGFLNRSLCHCHGCHDNESEDLTDEVEVSSVSVSPQ